MRVSYLLIDLPRGAERVHVTMGGDGSETVLAVGKRDKCWRLATRATVDSVGRVHLKAEWKEHDFIPDGAR